MASREELINRLEALESSPEMENPEFRHEVEALRKDLGLSQNDEITSLKEEVASLKNDLEDIKMDRLYDNIEEDSDEDYTKVMNSYEEYEDEEDEDEEKKGSVLLTIILSLLGILLLAGLIFGVYKLFFADNSKKNAEKEIFASSEVFINKAYENGIEYGEGEISSKQLVDLAKYGEIDVTANPAMIDTNEIGTKTLEYTISKGKERKTLTKEFEVKDTVLPEVSGVREKLELALNADFDLENFIRNLKVSDTVDGEFKRVEEEPTKNSKGGYDEGWYTVKSNVNTKEESTYNVTIHAVDKNGNVNDMVIPVKVSKESSNSSSNSSSSNNSQNTSGNTASNTTNNSTSRKKCQYKVVDQVALDEISNQIKVVDQPAKKRITEQVWVETEPAIPAVTREIYVIDVPADPEKGIEEKGHTETVVIVPEVPAKGYYEEKVIQEAQEEKWHYEKQIIQEAREEKYHYEERDCE